MRWRLVVLVTVPALVLAGFGFSHPTDLNAQTAPWWTALHTILLPVFPLLAVSLWVLLRDIAGPLPWVARIAAFAYAAFYTALDVLAGIATGTLMQRAQDSRRTPDIEALFEIGNELGTIGAWSYLLAAAAAALAILLRARLRALPGALMLVAGAIGFSRSHIYFPDGVASLLAVAIGSGLLAPAPRRGETA